MRITELKYYLRSTGSIIEWSCRGGSCSASKSGSTIGCGVTILPTTRDGIIWGEGDASMSVEGGLGAARVWNPVGGGWEDEDAYELPGLK